MGDSGASGSTLGMKSAGKMDPVTILLVLVVIFLVWQLVCKQKDGFHNGGLDYGNVMNSSCPNDYNIYSQHPAGPWGPMQWVGSGAALAGVSDRMDWMTNRFTTSARDNFTGSGLAGDSVTSPGALQAGPAFCRNDPRDVIGQARSTLSYTPVCSTPEMQDLIQYGTPDMS